MRPAASGWRPFAGGWRSSNQCSAASATFPIRAALDPIQAYTDFLHHRYLLSAEACCDIPNEEVFARWLEAGQPGYPLG